MKYIKNTVTLILLSSSLLCSAQNYTLSGRIVDKTTGESLNTAYLNVLQDGKRIVAEKVQDNGSYTVTLAKGNYVLTFSNEHYGDLTDSIKLDNNKAYDATLYPFLMYSSGKIYVVITILLFIILGLFIYLFNLDRKISNLEKD